MWPGSDPLTVVRPGATITHHRKGSNRVTGRSNLSRTLRSNVPISSLTSTMSVFNSIKSGHDARVPGDQIDDSLAVDRERHLGVMSHPESLAECPRLPCRWGDGR
jgi:hypothetical protein